MSASNSRPLGPSWLRCTCCAVNASSPVWLLLAVAGGLVSPWALPTLIPLVFLSDRSMHYLVTGRPPGRGYLIRLATPAGTSVARQN